MTLYIVKDDFLCDRNLKIVNEEVYELLPKIKPNYFQETQVFRLKIDDEYNGRRSDSGILNIFQAKLYSKDMINEITSHEDMSYKMYGLSHRYTTYLSQMREETPYRWHTDYIQNGNTWNRSFMSWIWYHNDDFEGGVLTIQDKDGKEHTIEPKANRLVLMPCYRTHSITTPIYKDSNYRTTINGFMNFD